MRKNTTGDAYLKRRPYRMKQAGFEEWQRLLDLMNHRFQHPFNNYWEQFGYETGGPVCYAYTKWISDEIEKSQGITDIAFIARDGWLLKQIYEQLPHTRLIKTHYVYASRTLALQCRNKDTLEEYKKYAAALGFGEGTVAVVDTVTMNFSSQRLLSLALPNRTKGFYWVNLRSRSQSHSGFDFCSYQTEDYHTIRCWNLIELIVTSPEPSVRGMKNMEPVYRARNADEQRRERIFASIERGVAAFVKDVLTDEAGLPVFSNKTITRWVNDFLRYPNAADRMHFQNVKTSELEDHSDSIPLSPFVHQGGVPSIKEIKDRIWYLSQRYKWAYPVLHCGKKTYRWLKDRIRAVSYVKFDGTKPEELAAALSQYDVVSFDIFDTLVFRTVKSPTDLFYRLENENCLPGFHDNRIHAEAAARQKRSGSREVTIYDIYSILAPRYGEDPESMVRAEVEEELRVCYGNKSMKRLVRILAGKGVRMIAVSDMYLPSGYLRVILDKCGFSDIERLFVSCEYGAGKMDGSLQHTVQSVMGEKKRIVHIGDNLDSDVRGSIKAGWTAVRYQSTMKRKGNGI